MRGVNKVIIVGTVGNNIHLNHTNADRPVVNMRIVTNEQWTNRQTGQRNEHAEWHSVVLFGRLAELAHDRLKKGSVIYVEGRIRTRKWLDHAGREQHKREIVADHLQFMDRKLNGRGRDDANERIPGDKPPATRRYGQRAGPPDNRAQSFEDPLV